MASIPRLLISVYCYSVFLNFRQLALVALSGFRRAGTLPSLVLDGASIGLVFFSDMYVYVYFETTACRHVMPVIVHSSSLYICIYVCVRARMNHMLLSTCHYASLS